MDGHKELASYTKLVEKMKTYYPELDVSSVTSMDTSLLCILTGFPKEFSKNLKSIRARLGISQKEMSLKLGISFVTYSYWETGANPPRITTLKEIFEKTDFFDPSEIISVNPVSPTSTIERKVPILPKNFFIGESFDSFRRKFERFQATDFFTIETQDSYDFALTIDDPDMVGYEKAIPVGAVVLCSYAPLLNKSRYEILRYINKKISVVGIVHREARIRETFFDEDFFTLRCWNATQPEKRFPVDLSLISKLDNPEKAKWLGYETHADNIEVFGIAKKVIFDLESVCL